MKQWRALWCHQISVQPLSAWSGSSDTSLICCIIRVLLRPCILPSGDAPLASLDIPDNASCGSTITFPQWMILIQPPLYLSMGFTSLNFKGTPWYSILQSVLSCRSGIYPILFQLFAFLESGKEGFIYLWCRHPWGACVGNLGWEMEEPCLADYTVLSQGCCGKNSS